MVARRIVPPWLSEHARALCSWLLTPDELLRQFQFRFAAGSRLQRVTHHKEDKNKASAKKEQVVASR